jgi:hypothetical protein
LSTRSNRLRKLAAPKVLLLAFCLAAAQAAQAEDVALHIHGSGTLASLERRSLSGEVTTIHLLDPFIVMPLSEWFAFPPAPAYYIESIREGPWSVPAPLAAAFDSFLAGIDPAYSVAALAPAAYSGLTARMSRALLSFGDVQDHLQIDVFSEWVDFQPGVMTTRVSWSYRLRTEQSYSTFGGGAVPTNPLTAADAAALINARGRVGFEAFAFVERCVDLCETPYVAYNGFADLAAFTAAVPEPRIYALLLAGLGLLGFAARRRRAALVISSL